MAMVSSLSLVAGSQIRAVVRSALLSRANLLLSQAAQRYWKLTHEFAPIFCFLRPRSVTGN
jgi:hypothetical protein